MLYGLRSCVLAAFHGTGGQPYRRGCKTPSESITRSFKIINAANWENCHFVGTFDVPKSQSNRTARRLCKLIRPLYGGGSGNAHTATL